MDNQATKSGKDPLVGVLLAVAGLLGALSLCQVAEFLETSRAAEAASLNVSVRKDPEPTDVQSQVAQDKSAAGNLKKKNLFVLPAAPRNPVSEVTGILGSEAFINGQWYKAGDRVSDAVIVAIEPTKVRVRWNGQETELLPIRSGMEGAVAGEPNPGSIQPGGVRRGGIPDVQGVPAVRTSGAPSVSVRGMRGGPLPEEMAALNERMRNASPEERRQIMQEMSQRFSGQ